MKTLRDLWERNAHLHADQPVCIEGGRRIDYAPFLERANRLAHALAARGVLPGDRVSILSMNRMEYLEVLAANHVLGSIAATLNFRLAVAEHEWILADSGPSVLFFEDAYIEAVTALRKRLPGIRHYVALGETPEWAERYEDLVDSGAPEAPARRPDPEDIAHLIYTSGTTGRPKGVMRSHRSEIAQAAMMSLGMDIRPRSRVLEVMPYFHVGAQASTWGALWRGAAVVVQRSFHTEAVLQVIASERITHLHLVPLMVQDLMAVPDLHRHDLSSVETLLYAAAPITPAVLRRGIEKLGPIFVGMWGMTEGSGTLLAKESHRPDGKPEEAALLASVGQEFQTARIRIVGEDGVDCAPGEAGELWLRSDVLLSGYWNNSRATVEALRDGWLRTGDMGYFDAHRNIFLVDRKKDMIISGGENIYSQEVERALAEHPGVAGVAVIGVPDERWGESVKAIVVLQPGANVDARELIEHCDGRIARYKKPRSVEYVSEFPVLPSGKINKVILRERFGKAGA